MSNEVAKTGWKATLEKQMPTISEAMPSHVGQERFQRIAANAIGSDHYLLKALKDNPRTVWSALMTAAKDGLLLDGREAALVAYGGKNGYVATYIPMIGGILKMMRQSGEVSSLTAHVVYANDQFDYGLGDHEFIEHKPFMTGARGEMVLAYAVLKTKDGGIYREVMPREDILAVKRISKAKNGPWNGPFESEMWKKTVLRRLAKRAPLSTDVLDLIQREDGMYDLSQPAKPKTTLDMVTGETRALENQRQQDDDDTPETLDGEIVDADEQEQTDAVENEPEADDSEPKAEDDQKPDTDKSTPEPDKKANKPAAKKSKLVFVKPPTKLAGQTQKAADAYAGTWVAYYNALPKDEEEAFLEETKAVVAQVKELDFEAYKWMTGVIQKKN